MFQPILALLFGFVLTFMLAPFALPALKKLKFGQTIYELGPKSHLAKQGTPTMGGLVFSALVVVAVFLFHQGSWRGLKDYAWPLVLIALGNMAVGLVDDYIKVGKKRSLGLTAKGKIIGQLTIGIIFSVYCYLHPEIGSEILVPFTSLKWDLGVFYIPVMLLLIIFMTNSANLQDGVDGLLASVTSIGSLGFGFIALMAMGPLAKIGAGGEAGNLAVISIFAFSLAGACLGFLRVNYYPAKLFMGDTGSMFIGGGLVGMALLLKQPFLLLFFCLPLILSSLSVIIQRIYFKATQGKRIFKMSPLHHHFELSGYSEGQIVMMYMAVTILLTVVAILGML